jgi:O-glycosyl hydrolase
MLISLLFIGSGITPPAVGEALWQETRFTTGCEPGPSHTPPWPEHRETHVPGERLPVQSTLRIDLDSAMNQRPMLGSGFNFEHGLWSCPAFRGLFRREILDPFTPAVARVDTGLLPAAPPNLSADELNDDVYASMLSSPQYADSWRFMKRLNRAGVKIALGVWGGPEQFTADGTRRSLLLPQHYDDYAEYLLSVVDYIVHRQGVDVWAITIANEPDGGDGNQIPPDGVAYIGHRVAPHLESLGVKLYGPDTANADLAMQYLPLLLEDPVIADRLAFVGFHQYYPDPAVATVVDYVRARRPELPVIITEYTSFCCGDLDDGQEVNDRIGYTLDIVNMLLAHYRYGVDAALYWDAVDYLQPGHDAITRWGILRGPSRDFARRTRYYGMVQVLPYLQPGTRVLVSELEGAGQPGTLAVQTPSGAPAIFVVNQDSEEVDLSLELTGLDSRRFHEFTVWRTDRSAKAERLGRLQLTDGVGRISIPPRSLTTLFPSGAATLTGDLES